MFSQESRLSSKGLTTHCITNNVDLEIGHFAKGGFESQDEVDSKASPLRDKS